MQRPSAVGEYWCERKYRIVAKLGQGGMSEVFLALVVGPIPEVQKLVVLKRLRVGLRDDPEFMKMFVREARIAARFSHPNVVQTYALEVHEGDAVIVMEYIDGITLDRMMAQVRDLPFLERLPLVGAVAQMLRGLGYVHDLRDYDDSRLNLVHRDVKPSNVFVTFDGHVKLVDFGVAAPSDATVGGLLKGTPAYMAPELVDLPPRITQGADIFSTGAILWEIIYGRALWSGCGQMQVLYGLSRRELPAFDPVGDDVPAELLEICRRALASEPELRQASADELRVDLESMLRADASLDTQAALASMLFVGFSGIRRARTGVVQRGVHGANEAPPAEDGAVAQVVVDPTVVRPRSRPQPEAEVDPTIVRPLRGRRVPDDDFVAVVEATIARLDAELSAEEELEDPELDQDEDENEDDEPTRLMAAPSPRLTLPYAYVPLDRTAALRTARPRRARDTQVVPALNRTVTVPAAKPPAWMPERLPVPPPARLRWVVLIVLAVLTLAGCAAALVWMASQDGTVTAAA